MEYPSLLQKHIWRVLHPREVVPAWQVGTRHPTKKGSNAKTLTRTDKLVGRGVTWVLGREKNVV